MVILNSGSAFNGAGINRHYIKSTIKDRDPILNIIRYRERTNYVSFTEFCARNFISKDIGRSLIKKKLLICQRLYGKLWVTSDPNCRQELLDYLLVNSLNFDAEN
jgi:hypothetical protein